MHEVFWKIGATGLVLLVLMALLGSATSRMKLEEGTQIILGSIVLLSMAAVFVGLIGAIWTL